MQATERIRDGLRAVIYTDTAAGVDRYLARVRQSGELVGHDKPAAAGRGLWRVRVVLWATTEPVRAPRAELAPPAAGWSPRWPTWATGEVMVRTAVVLGAAAALVAVGWLMWRAVEGAVAWAGQHRGQLVTAAVVAVGLWLWWAVHRLRAGRRQLVHHCPGCPHGRPRG